MHGKNDADILAGEVLDEDATLTLAELCRTCGVHEDWIVQLVEEGRFRLAFSRLEPAPCACSAIRESISQATHWRWC